MPTEVPAGSGRPGTAAWGCPHATTPLPSRVKVSLTALIDDISADITTMIDDDDAGLMMMRISIFYAIRRRVPPLRCSAGSVADETRGTTTGLDFADTPLLPSLAAKRKMPFISYHGNDAAEFDITGARGAEAHEFR